MAVGIYQHPPRRNAPLDQLLHTRNARQWIRMVQSPSLQKERMQTQGVAAVKGVGTMDGWLAGWLLRNPLDSILPSFLACLPTESAATPHR